MSHRRFIPPSPTALLLFEQKRREDARQRTREASLRHVLPYLSKLCALRLRQGLDIEDAGVIWQCCVRIVSERKDLHVLAEMDDAEMDGFGVPHGWAADVRETILRFLEARG